MSLRAMTQLPAGGVVEAEVAVVGSGPAGLAVATELAAAGVDVLLLEAGQLGAPAAAEASAPPELVLGERTATFRSDRRFGGTRWYGRCVPPDRGDFAPRRWVPGSGWPIAAEEVESRLVRAARWLGLERPEALSEAAGESEPAWRRLAGGGLAPRAHLISPARDLGRRRRAEVAASARLQALLGATLVGFDLEPARPRVELARFAGADGAERAVRARQYVLACGGLENARQLLLLADAAPGRLGASAAVLGRGLFDHARCDGLARLHLDPAAPDAAAIYRGLVEHRSAAAGARTQVAVGLAPERQRDEELLNPCGFFYPVSRLRLAALGAAAAGLRSSLAARQPSRDDPARLVALFGGLPLVVAALAARARKRPYRLAHLALVEQLEQPPSEAGSVELGPLRDRFGRRRLRVRWSVGEQTRRTQRRFHQLLAARLAATGVGRLESPLLADAEFRPDYGDAAHPMGTTRMSLAPSQGVVDPDARLHAVQNLWVAGSSIFPTCGNANPTLTLVALAFRLADRLVAATGASRT